MKCALIAPKSLIIKQSVICQSSVGYLMCRIMSNMRRLPAEIMEMILQYLPYPEMGRVMVVNKRWKSLIEEMLPSIRQLSINDMGLNCLDEFRLYSTFKGKPLYKSRHLWLLNEKLRGVFLYQLDDSWFVSSVPGVLDKGEGYLKSNNKPPAPPETEWKWCQKVPHGHQPKYHITANKNISTDYIGKVL